MEKRTRLNSDCFICVRQPFGSPRIQKCQNEKRYLGLSFISDRFRFRKLLLFVTKSSPYECTNSLLEFGYSVVFGLYLRNRTFKFLTERGLRKKKETNVFYTRLRKPYGSAGLGQNQRKYLISKMQIRV